MITDSPATFILITPNRVVRAEFDGSIRTSRSAARPLAGSLADAVRVALGLGGKPSRRTWVLTREVWEQEIKLSANQTAGLTPEQLERALSFEAEPFSGIPVMESATGFRDKGAGVYLVAQISTLDRDGVAQAVAGAGGMLAGLVNPGPAPEDDEALIEWWPTQLVRLASAPVIAPAPPAPSPRRFLVGGIIAEAAVIALLVVLGVVSAIERKVNESRFAEGAAASKELDATTRQNDALRKQIAALEKQAGQRAEIRARRGAVLALLEAVAARRSEDVVVRTLTAEGPSSIVISGLALEAEAVDEFVIVLTQALREVGWTAQPRSKVGRRFSPTGGPWEFSIVVSHAEVAPKTGVQLSRRDQP